MIVTRESVFLATLRAFCRTFAVVFALVICFVGVMVLAGLQKAKTMPPSVMVYAEDHRGSREPLDSTKPVVLRLNIHGIIGSGDLTTERFETLLLDAKDNYLKNRVKALLLHINTPGGSALDSDGIYSLLKQFKEENSDIKIYAFVDGLCASGGMFIASAADHVIATPSSLIGSVGVRFGPFFNVADPMEKLGIKEKTLTKGKDKDMMNPFRAWTETEDKSFMDAMDEAYDRFVTVVSQARPKLSVDVLKDTTGAHIFAAKKALDLGFIDSISETYRKALKEFVSISAIEGDYQVFIMTAAQNALNDLLDGRRSLFPNKIEHALSIKNGFQDSREILAQ